ncbi:hypothetical protein FS320_44985, partial [Microvirga tunisiensis]|nr:hypothetical protein [Microvirga tunisiensis]MPR31766.1 hypothetical protein [Microvirga tunisiensis]
CGRCSRSTNSISSSLLKRSRSPRPIPAGNQRIPVGARAWVITWDRLNAHRSRATTDFIAAHAQDYAVAYLPAYAPELNPEEQCNALVKRAMANALPGSVDDLHRLARREFGRLKRHPEMIVRFFRHAGLSVTGCHRAVNTA